MKVVCIEQPLTAHYSPFKKGEIYDAELVHTDEQYYMIHHLVGYTKIKKSCFITLEEHIQKERDKKIEKLLNDRKI